MLYTDLAEYYKTINLLLDYKYDPGYVENLIPFERELHISLVIQNDESDQTAVNVEAPED